MAESVPSDVRQRCRALTRHLIGRDPSDYVIERFSRGLRSPAFNRGLSRGAADLVLDRFARLGHPGLSLADAYARLFAPAGAFRRTLVLLVAILESAPDTFDRFEPPAAGRLRAWSALFASGLRFAAVAAIATIVIGPLHLGARKARGRTDDQPVERRPA